MKKIWITIGISLSVFAAIGSFIFLGVTIYNFNNDFISKIGVEAKEDNNTSSKTSSEIVVKEKKIIDAMKIVPAIKRTAIVDEDEKAIIIEYMEHLKTLKDKQSGYISFFNHEQNQLKIYKIPNLRVPHLHDISNPDEIIVRQKEVIEGVTDIPNLSRELGKIHDNLIEMEKNLLSYHEKMANYLITEEDLIMDEALIYFAMANDLFRQYKIEFIALCEIYGIAFEGNWKEMFPESKSMGFPERSSRPEETKPSFSGLETTELIGLLKGKWIGKCPEEQGDDLGVSLEYLEDLTYKKMSGGLVYTGNFKILEDNSIEFTNKTRGDDVLEVADDNVYTVKGSVIENVGITFMGDIRRLGCSHGNYIFTKEK